MHILAFMEWYHFSICKHTVDKLSGLRALQSSHYKGDNITNARHLIDQVVLAEAKKNYFFAQTTVLIRLQADLGYKPRPQTSHPKINLINTNCKCIILGYKPRAILGLEVYRRP